MITGKIYLKTEMWRPFNNSKAFIKYDVNFYGKGKQIKHMEINWLASLSSCAFYKSVFNKDESVFGYS